MAKVMRNITGNCQNTELTRDTYSYISPECV